MYGHLRTARSSSIISRTMSYVPDVKDEKKGIPLFVDEKKKVKDRRSSTGPTEVISLISDGEEEDDVVPGGWRKVVRRG